MPVTLPTELTPVKTTAVSVAPERSNASEMVTSVKAALLVPTVLLVPEPPVYTDPDTDVAVICSWADSTEELFALSEAKPPA